MKRFKLLLHSLTLLLACTTGIANAVEKRVALVIGNGTYSSQAALSNPPNDSADMVEALKKVGFEVTYAKNLTLKEMTRAISRFGDLSADADFAVVFYAGHGMQARGENYLLPVDATLLDEDDLAIEAVPLSYVLNNTDGAKMRVVMLDACRDNPLANSMKRKGGTRGGTRGLARVPETSDSIIAFATRDGFTAADGDGRNSPFTRAVLDAIQVPGLELSLFFRRVADTVKKTTKGQQSPVSFQDMGEQAYYFVAPKPVAPGPSPSTPAGPDPGQIEMSFWNAISTSTNMADYENYLAKYPTGLFADLAKSKLNSLRAKATPKPPPGPDPSAVEITYWNSISGSKNAAEFEAYLAKYPACMFVDLAKAKLSAIRSAMLRPVPAAPAVDPHAADKTYWNAIARSESVVEYEGYLEKYPSGVYADLARERITRLRGPSTHSAKSSAPAPVVEAKEPPPARVPSEKPKKKESDDIMGF